MDTSNVKQQKQNTEITISQRREFLKLTIEKSYRILEQQSNQIQHHYQENTEWQEWLEGDIIEY